MFSLFHFQFYSSSKAIARFAVCGERHIELSVLLENKEGTEVMSDSQHLLSGGSIVG